MRIHEIVIVPSAGHLGPGTYNRGKCHGNLAEVDLVDQYVRNIIEELDNSSVRHRVLPTRKGPGIPPEDHISTIFPCTLVLHCGIGANKAQKIRAAYNQSATYFSDGGQTLAKELSIVMGHWGNLYVHGHKSCLPNEEIDDPFMRIAGTIGIKLEPFQVNGPSATDYAKWIPKLGRDIGRFLADFVKNKDHGAMIKSSIAMAPKKAI